MQIEAPPLELEPAARAYWNDLVVHQRHEDFAAADWLLMCKLTRLMVFEDELVETLISDGFEITSNTGARRQHPAVSSLASVTRAIVQICQALRLTRSGRIPRDSKRLREDNV